MQITPGDLLIAHPHWGDSDCVCFVTEHTRTQTIALELNTPASVSLSQLEMADGAAVALDQEVYHGGDHNPHSLVLLHDSNWYSSNTMPITRDWSITSDYHMLEKLDSGNTPRDFRVMLGVSAWHSDDLDYELSSTQGRWLLLPKPTIDLVMCDPDDQYTLALDTWIKLNTQQHFG